MRVALAASFLSLGGVRCVAAEPISSVEAERLFESQVRPILSMRCWQCHGPTKQESGLRLDSRDGLQRGGDSASPILDAKDPRSSLLLKAIRHEGDLKMPPDARLSDEQIKSLEEWIAIGAPWTRTANLGAPANMADRLRTDRNSHWSFQRINRPPLPPVRSRHWPANSVDYFVLEPLESVGLSPSAAASSFQLIRRMSFDVCGLPAAAAESLQFEQDDRPDRVDRLVDRLLASPRYGERWGRHWLDVARYADTKGYAFDKDRRYPYAYTYRDYVIGAWNRDLPFDDFIRQQIAADLLSEKSEPTQLAALGFLTTGRKFNNFQDDVDDKIDVVTRGLMGITVACARCHDHKYDAVPMDDYYSLYGVFASCHEPADLPLLEVNAESAEYAKFQAELQILNEKLENLYRELHVSILSEVRERAGDYLVKQLLKLPDEDLAQLPFYKSGKSPLRRQFVERWQSYLQRHTNLDDPVWGIWNALSALPSDLSSESFEDQAKVILAARGWAGTASIGGGTSDGTSKSPSSDNSLIGGAFSRATLTSRADVARIYGQVLSDAVAQAKSVAETPDGSEKTTPEQKQVVAVLIGSDSPTDVQLEDIKGLLNRAERGKQTAIQKQIDALSATSPGAPPRAMIVAENSQPHEPRVFIRGNPNRPGKVVPRQFLELLSGDAREPFQQGSGRRELAEAVVSEDNPLTRRVLVNRIWMHHFVEPLVLTPSDFGLRCPQPVHANLLDYLSASLAENNWSIKRLHRELLLSSTYGQSSDEHGEGRAVDVENRLFWRMNRRRLEFESLRDSILFAAGELFTVVGGRPVELTKAPFSTRRSVYGYIDRQDLPNLFRVFDLASPDQSNERRPRTTVPQQALFLMNSTFVWEQAGKIAERTAGKPAELQAREMYRLILGRGPSEDELQLACQFVSGHEAPQSAWQELAQILLACNEFTFVD